MKTKLLTIAAFVFATIGAIAEDYKAPDTSGDPIEVTAQLYSDLQNFKDDEKFHKVGFAPSEPKTKYRIWFEAFELANKDPRYNKALILKGIAIGDLYILGKDYMTNKGKTTEYAKFINAEFARALK